MADNAAAGPDGEAPDATRRDFIFIAAGSLGAVGAAMTIWPFINQMSPASDTRAVASTDVDLSPIPVGQKTTVTWQGKPVFILHRSPEQIAAAERDDNAALKDPQIDADRLKQKSGEPGREEFLIVQAACTHLGCIPEFPRGDYAGWFCPCHGSHYDTSARIRRGPAPKNLVVAPYVFTNAEKTAIRIG